MTEPGTREDDLRDALMDPLSRTIPASQVWAAAGLLLPIVQALMNKHTAAELDEMSFRMAVRIDAENLRARAAALRPQPTKEDVR